MNERLTDDEIHALWVEHVGTHTSHTGFARAIESAVLARSAVPPEGWKLVAVNAAFDDLLTALDRAERKGYMPDAMASEWAAFEFRPLAAPQAEARQEPKPNTCKLTECQGKPRCKPCLAMDSVYQAQPKGGPATARDAARYEQDLWLRELFRLIEAWRVLRDGIPVKAEAWSALWRHAHNIGPHWRARAYLAGVALPREPEPKGGA